MANEEVKTLAQILGTWLKEDRGKLKIDFFDMEAEKWEKEVQILQNIFPDEEFHQDAETMRKILEGWSTRIRACNDATILEIDLAARNVPNDLRFNQAARKLWYNKMKGQNAEVWGDEEPPQAKWASILTNIVNMMRSELTVVETRWTEAKAVKTSYTQFDAVAKKYGSRNMKLKISTRQIGRDQVIESIQNANTMSEEWITKLNEYYNFQPNNAQKKAMKLFFPGPDGMNRTEIRWNDFVQMLQTKKSRLAAFVLDYGGSEKTINDFPEQAQRMDMMTEIYEKLSETGPGQRAGGQAEEEESKADKARRIKATFIREVLESYDRLVIQYEEDNEMMRPIDLSESKTKAEKKMIENLIATYEDIKKNDKDWNHRVNGIEKVNILSHGVGEEAATFFLLMKMKTSLEEREDVFEEKRKSKQYWKSNQMKRVEEIVKPENRYIYREEKDFLPWLVDHKKMIEALPPELEKDMLMSYIAKTIENKEIKEALRMCRDPNAMIQLMADKHMTDKNLINNAFQPVRALKYPKTFTTSYANIEVILQTIDNLSQVKVLGRVEVTDYTECVNKAFHPDRRQAWFAHAAELRRIEEIDEDDGDKSLIEQRGMIDIEKLVQKNNAGNTVATNLRNLQEYLKTELLIAQDQKDMESTFKIPKKHEGFFQSEDETTNLLYGGQTSTRGGRGGGQTNPRGNNQRGGGRGGQRQQAVPRKKVPKYPVDQKALAKAIANLKPNQRNPPPIADCPIGCHHALPYGTAELCEDFQSKDLSMKQDTVKKSNLCRKCLKAGFHPVQDCYADNCGKCGGDHHTLICPKPKGQQAYSNQVENHQSLYTDSIYGEQNKQCFATGNEDSNNPPLDGYDGYEDQVDGYDLQQEDVVGIMHITDNNSFDLNDYVVVDSEDESGFEEPEEPMNSFRVTLADGCYEIEKVEYMHENEADIQDESDMSLNLRPEYLREADVGQTQNCMNNREQESQTFPAIHMSGTKLDGHIKGAESKQHALSGGADEKGMMGKFEENNDPLKQNGPGNENRTRGRQDNDSNQVPDTDVRKIPEIVVTDCDAELSKLTNDIVTRDANVKVGKPPDQQNSIKPLSWMEKVWATVPRKSEDWIKSVKTQERPWGDQKKAMWNIITQDAGINEDQHVRDEPDDSLFSSQPTNYQQFLNENRKVQLTDQVSIDRNKYVRYTENEDYIILRPTTCRTRDEKDIFDRMVQTGSDLKELFPAMRGMTSKVTIKGKPISLEGDMEQVGEDLIKTTAIFDGGSDVACHSAELSRSIELPDLAPQFTTMKTTNGASTKEYKRKAIKVVGEVARDNRDLIQTIASMDVGSIGNEKRNMTAYVNLIAELMDMPESLRRHLLEQCEDNEDRIHLLIGQKEGGLLMNEVHPEQLGLRQHHLLPNIIIYENPLTKKLILAGDIGINKELIGDDFPVLYVHKDNWQRMIDLKRNGEDKELGRMIGEGFDIKKLLKMNQMKLSSNYQPKKEETNSFTITEKDIKEIDTFLDSIHGDKEEVTHKLNQSDCNYYMDLSGINTQLDCVYGENQKDEYILNEKEYADAARILDQESKEETNVGFTNNDCDMMKRFIEAESSSHPELSCDRCRKKDCDECNMLRDKYSAEDSKIYKQVWENTRLVNVDGQQRVQVEYVYRNDPHETFKPENSNINEAKARTDNLIRKLKKTGELDNFIKEIEKKRDIKTLVPLTQAELNKVLRGTHHFSYLSMVKSETSTSTSTRLINDTLTSNGKGASYSLENKVPTSQIGDSFQSLVDFRLYEHGYSSDISKCYLRVLVDSLTSHLRLCYWYEDPETMTKPLIFKRPTMDFGDSIASLVIRIIQLKFLMPATNIDLVRSVIRKGAYADNYSSSYQTIEEYNIVKTEMEKIHKEIGLPLKATYSDINTDPEVKSRINKGEEATYNFLGLSWCLLTNTLLPNIYFNLMKKHKGTSGSKKIIDMTEADFDTDNFVWGITRRNLSRLAAQTYSRLGMMLAPLIMALKICVSRSCEIMQNTELDVPIATKDIKFARTAKQICKEIPKLKRLKPFNKAVIPKGAKLKKIVGFGDGGAPGYDGNWYMCSKIDNRDIINQLINKTKVCKRTIPAHETLVKAHHMGMMKELARAIEHRKEIVEEELEIYSIGDSICTACLFNPNIEIRNVLIKSAIWSTKQRCREILEILPNAVIHLTWMPGVKNTADYGSKLHTNIVDILNADDYRHGVEGMLTLNRTDHISYYTVSKDKEAYTPLPDHLIEGAKETERKLIDMDPTRTMSNNRLEQEETATCGMCIEKEDCGIYATTRSAKKTGSRNTEKKSGHEEDRLRVSIADPMYVPDPDGFEGIKATSTKVEDTPGKKQETENDKVNRCEERIVRENAHYRAQRESTEKNLFEDDRDYILSDNPMDLNVVFGNRTLRVDNMISVGRYIAKWQAQRKRETTLEDGRIEIWRKMLITSQAESPPPDQKGYEYDTISGVICLKLRIAKNNAMDIWGSRVLPVIHGESTLGIKLIREAHEKAIHLIGAYHQGPEATLSSLHSGEKGVFIPQARKWIGKYITGCSLCRETRQWTYTVPQKDKYTKNTMNATPFREISIDMLGPIEAKTFPGAKKTYKLYPFLVRCLQTGAIWATLMEGAGTNEVVKALIKLEVTYGRVCRISSDAGSNMLRENLNPITVLQEGNAPRRLLGIIDSYVTPVDGQFRNYTERSTGMLKRMIRNLSGARKDREIPPLPKTSLDLILLVAVDACNKVPLGRSEGVYLCPADLLSCRTNEVRIETTASKLHNLDKMMEGLTQYFKIVNNTRNNILRENLKAFHQKKLNLGKGAKEISAHVGDLVLIKNSDNEREGTYGVIQEIEGDSTAILRTRKGIMRRAICQLIPLAGSCLVSRRRSTNQ